MEGDSMSDNPRNVYTIKISVNDGTEIVRTYAAYNSADIDWNPIVNDMVDTLEDNVTPF